MKTALCVGGPFAGRMIDLPYECRVINLPAWPSPRQVLREYSIQNLDKIDRLDRDIHAYRWHVGEIATTFMTIKCATLVHDSMTNSEAARAAFVAALTMMLDIKDSQ